MSEIDVTIIDEDREERKAWVRSLGITVSGLVRLSAKDHDKLDNAFARHRQAAEAKAEARGRDQERARWEEAVKAVCRDSQAVLDRDSPLRGDDEIFHEAVICGATSVRDQTISTTPAASE